MHCHCKQIASKMFRKIEVLGDTVTTKPKWDQYMSILEYDDTRIFTSKAIVLAQGPWKNKGYCRRLTQEEGKIVTEFLPKLFIPLLKLSGLAGGRYDLSQLEYVTLPIYIDLREDQYELQQAVQLFDEFANLPKLCSVVLRFIIDTDKRKPGIPWPF